MKKIFNIKSEVWRWPGVGGWYFVYVDRKFNGAIRTNGSMYGSGFVKIRATVGGTSWDTALFPYKKEDAFLISIKASVRKKEGIDEGDVVKIRFELL
jgi:hypothetical protein